MPSVPRLLLDETPVIILPSLVRALGGIPEAVFVQQVHYRAREGREQNGYRWAVETRQQWQEHCCLTERQIRRVISDTVKSGVLVRWTPEWRGVDKTAWTRLDYSVLDALVSASGGPSIGTKRPDADRDETSHSKGEGPRLRHGGEKAPGGARRFVIPEGYEEPI